MSKPELPLKSGFWQDCFTAWRRLYCYTQRAGVVRKAKREYNKAVRRKAKQEAHNE